MSNFEIALKYLLNLEGGYVFDIVDLGGETKFGISKKQYPLLDIKNLTLDQASEIYKNDYWIKYRIEEIIPQKISNQILSIFVNISTKNAGLIIQRAIKSCNREIDEDGIFGTRSILAVNSLSHNWFSDRLRIELIKFYLDSIQQNKNMLKFLQGWMHRALA